MNWHAIEQSKKAKLKIIRAKKNPPKTTCFRRIFFKKGRLLTALQKNPERSGDCLSIFLALKI